jgi:4-nitrophenyl phosphatase
LTIGLLIDLDGTLYRGHHCLPFASEWISVLRRAEIPFLFVTNNSARTPEQVAEHLNGMGIAANVNEVMTSAMATAAYIRANHLGKRVYVIGEEGLKQAMVREGLTLCESEAEVDVVVSGLDRKITYEKYTIAVRAILNGAKYVMTNPDQLLPSEDGFLPGSGSLAAVIRTATGAQPVIIGKPSSILMQAALDRLALRADQAWAVGDHVLTDIAAAHATGMPSILLLTGVATKENLATWYEQTEARPDLIFEDLQPLLELTKQALLSENPTLHLASALHEQNMSTQEEGN